MNAGPLEAVAWVAVMLLAATLVITLGAQHRRRRRAESELAVAERHLRMAATAGGIGLWVRDLEQGVYWSNNEHRAILGIDGSETPDLAGHLDRVHEDDRAQVAAEIQRAMRDGGEYSVRHRIVLRDGTERWVASHGSVQLDRQGNPASVRGATFDVSPRVRSELDAEVHRNELARLSRVAMLGQLSGSIAHELNQPLTAILSNAQAALRFTNAAQVDLEGIKEILRDIVADDRRAGDVIRRLRTLFERGEAKREAVDAEKLIREVVRMLRSDFISRNVTVTLDLAHGLPKVQADPVQLQQVLLNLIVNACDAMGASGSNARSLLIAAAPRAAGQVSISVVDDGPGIPPERLERIFEAFESSKPLGIGLGLAISRSIVTAHGGRLWCTNNVGRGATFTFTIPASDAERVAGVRELTGDAMRRA
jgi:signal transduction histidine kinase